MKKVRLRSDRQFTIDNDVNFSDVSTIYEEGFLDNIKSMLYISGLSSIMHKITYFIHYLTHDNESKTKFDPTMKNSVFEFELHKTGGKPTGTNPGYRAVLLHAMNDSRDRSQVAGKGKKVHEKFGPIDWFLRASERPDDHNDELLKTCDEYMAKGGRELDLVNEILMWGFIDAMPTKGMITLPDRQTYCIIPEILSVYAFSSPVMIASKMLHNKKRSHFSTCEEKLIDFEYSEEDEIRKLQKTSRAIIYIANKVGLQTDGNNGNLCTIKCNYNGQDVYLWAFIDFGKCFDVEERYIQQKAYILTEEEKQDKELLECIIEQLGFGGRLNDSVSINSAYQNFAKFDGIIENICCKYVDLSCVAPFGFIETYRPRNTLINNIFQVCYGMIRLDYETLKALNNVQDLGEDAFKGIEQSLRGYIYDKVTSNLTVYKNKRFAACHEVLYQKQYTIGTAVFYAISAIAFATASIAVYAYGMDYIQYILPVIAILSICSYVGRRQLYGIAPEDMPFLESLSCFVSGALPVAGSYIAYYLFEESCKEELYYMFGIAAAAGVVAAMIAYCIDALIAKHLLVHSYSSHSKS